MWPHGRLAEPTRFLWSRSQAGAPTRLALLLAGTDAAGEATVVSFAAPTIPPMVRQPFSNTFPDFVVAGNTTRADGACASCPPARPGCKGVV